LRPAPSGSYLARRWRGDVPIATLLGRDMLLIGTAINIGATFAGLTSLVLGAATWLALVLHFSPMPFNLFLFAAVCRSPARTPMTITVASVWLALMTVV
jgi:hypothetical protein